MQLGMVGLGRMGSGMTGRLQQDGHDVKTYDPKVESTAGSLKELASQLEAPRAVWLMIPAGKITEDAFQELLERLKVLLGDLDRLRGGGPSRAPHHARLGRAAAGEDVGPIGECGRRLAATEPADQQADRQHHQADLK